MSTEVIIGPQPCYYCGGAYGEHAEDCPEVRPKQVPRTITKYAAIAYNAYCKSRNWKSVKGEPLPHFEQQSYELQAAWQVAVDEVIAEINSDAAPG